MKSAPPASEFAIRGESHRRKLLAYVRGKGLDPAEAEDIVQQTLLRAWEYRDTLAAREDWLPWLRTVALNLTRMHWRKRKPGRLGALAEEFAQAPPATRDTIAGQFRQAVEALAGMRADAATATILLLHECLGWTARRIAQHLQTQPNTIASRIARFRRRAAPAPEVAERDLDAIYFRLAQVICNEGLDPTTGSAFRNTALVREAVAILDMLTARQPDDFKAVHLKMKLHFYLASAAEYPSDLVPARTIADMRRELWDPEHLRLASEAAARLQKMDIPPAVRLDCEYAAGLHLPKRAEDVDWHRLLDITRKLQTLVPIGFVYYRVAICLRMTEGPLAAAKYMMKYLDNPFVADDRRYLRELGYYFMEAGRHAEALRYFKKSRKYPTNEPQRLRLELWIARCKQQRRGE